MIHAYPSELAAFVRARWSSREVAHGDSPNASLPSAAHLEEILSVAYQATLLREEERTVTFRLVLGDPSVFPVEDGPPTGFHRLVFVEPQPLTEHELRRLSPAAKYHRALLGVSIDPARGPMIWGMLQSGAQWLRASQGGRRLHASPPANAFVVRAIAPGRLAVARGEETLGELRAGHITRPTMDIFDSSWLTSRFKDARGEIAALHEEARSKASSPWAKLDPRLTSTLAQHMIKRVIATMRAAHHGGTIVLLPPDSVNQVIAESGVIHLKHAFRDEEPRRRFSTLLLRVMNTLAEAGGTAHAELIDFSSYETSTNPVIAEIEESIFELSHLIAALADVDGAVVLSKRFELLGFGAEIGGAFGAQRVDRALDLEGKEFESERIDRVGTRHRSAYRLCELVPGALAVVVSQDGNARFVAWMDGRVVCFDHLVGETPLR